MMMAAAVSTTLRLWRLISPTRYSALDVGRAIPRAAVRAANASTDARAIWPSLLCFCFSIGIRIKRTLHTRVDFQFLLQALQIKRQVTCGLVSLFLFLPQRP